MRERREEWQAEREEREAVSREERGGREQERERESRHGSKARVVVVPCVAKGSI